jgi:hypothetical protein
VDNLFAVFTLTQQNNQSNTQWYEKLNTCVNMAESVGVDFGNFTSLWGYCCNAQGWGKYEMLMAAEQTMVPINSKERLLGYLTNSQ